MDSDLLRVRIETCVWLLVGGNLEHREQGILGETQHLERVFPLQNSIRNCVPTYYPRPHSPTSSSSLSSSLSPSSSPKSTITAELVGGLLSPSSSSP